MDRISYSFPIFLLHLLVPPFWGGLTRLSEGSLPRSVHGIHGAGLCGPYPRLLRFHGVPVLSFTGYVLIYELLPYGCIVFRYVLTGTVTWLLLRPSLPGDGCLPLRSSAARCRHGHCSCRIPGSSIPGR